MAANMFSSLWTSLVASLVVTCFLVPFAIAVWNKVLLPWWIDKAYRDRRISGEWKAEAKYNLDGKAITEREIVTVNQVGYSVSGEMAARTSGDNTVYAFKGEIVNSILTASYWKKGKDNSHDRGTIALRVFNDDKLDGSFTFYEDSRILSGQYTWKK